MQRLVSLFLTLVGFVIIIVGLLSFHGQTRVMVSILGVIIACGGLLMLLNRRVSPQQRPFILIISILFVLLIIGYVIKVTMN